MNTIARTSFGLLAVACLTTVGAVAQSNTPTTAKAAASAAATMPAASGAMDHSHETVEYKDPEDMTTRYRPGNNKTTRLPSRAATSAATTTAAAAGAAAGQPASDADAKKHVANIKWTEKTVTLPACDGASKDAAKCATAPATGNATASGTATPTR
jgi:hypothetical protein